MIVTLLAVAAVAGFGLALYKHTTVAATAASIKREAVLIENEAVKLAGEAKAAILAAVTRLKAL